MGYVVGLWDKEMQNRVEVLSKYLFDYIMNDTAIMSDSLRDASTRLVFAEGKYVRPLLYTLGCDEVGENWRREKHIYNAIALELLHVSTLIHDDIIDNDVKRRGEEAIHVVFGEDIAILAGNVAYSLAIDLTTYKEEMNLIYKRINDGQALELDLRDMVLNGWFDSREYVSLWEHIAFNKTACFLASSLSLPARNIDVEKEGSLQTIGGHMGMIYQIHNDLIDYIPTGRKDFCSDLRERKPTLIYFYARERSIDIFDEYSYYYDMFSSNNNKYRLYEDMLSQLKEAMVMSDAGKRLESAVRKVENMKYFIDNDAHERASTLVISKLRKEGVFDDVIAFAKEYYYELKQEMDLLTSPITKQYISKLVDRIIGEMESFVEEE